MNAHATIRFFGVVVLLATASVQCSDIHERMTDDEIAKVFGTTRDNMPEYDVALVRHNRRKRWQIDMRVQFTAFGEEIDAYLQPSDGELMGTFTPVWLASSKPDGTIEYKKMREGIVGRVASKFFSSPRDLSMVAVTQTRGKKPSFDGVFGSLVLRSLPKSLREEARSRRSSEAPNATGTMLDSDYHVVIKSPLATEAKIKRVERQIREASRSASGNGGSRVERSTANAIYPSVLVQTDYDASKTTQNDTDHYEEILYQLGFWNAVDLRFRHVDNPKIRMRIAGIIIGQDRNATPYLEHHRSGGVVDLRQCYDNLREHWYNMSLRAEFPAEAYHIVVTLTDTDMAYDGKWAGGLARESHCLKNKSGRKFDGAAIARDRGGFEGVLTTAHELGHIFGLDDDVKFDDDKCDESNGFLMATNRKPGPKNLKWSPCSLAQFSTFLRNDFIDCYDWPADYYSPGYPLRRLLPGNVLGPHQQCQGLGYDWACDASPDMCTQMQCFHEGRQCKNAGPAAEGTLCAPGHKCIDGACQCMTTDCIYKNWESSV